MLRKDLFKDVVTRANSYFDIQEDFRPWAEGKLYTTEPVPEVERLVQRWQADGTLRIKHDIENDPHRSPWFYNKLDDYIGKGMTISSLPNAPTYYSLLFHEMTHWAGGTARLNRTSLANGAIYVPAGLDFLARPNKPYVVEEITAEMGSAILLDHFGLSKDTEELNAKYIGHYMGKLTRAEGMLLLPFAWREAVRAADYLLQREE